MMLCSLSDVKILLGIALSDTSSDALLNKLISRISNRVVKALGFPVKRDEYVGEKHSVNNSQKLYLKAFPIQEVTAVTIAGRAVTDYSIESDGSLYYGNGWSGNFWARGMTYDPVSGVREVLVSYVGGWYLPGDEDYEAGDVASLPEGVSEAIAEDVVVDYRRATAETEGLKSHGEGGISDTWFENTTETLGLSMRVFSSIEPYIRKFGIA